MITNRGKVKAMKSGFLAALFVLAASSVSHAGPLGVTTVVPYPDIATGFLTTTYRATTNVFTVNGWALSLDKGTGTKQNITTNFSLTATIDNNGNLVTGAGAVNQLVIGTAATPLLKSLSILGMAYSYNPVGTSVFEFLFASPTGTYTTDGPPSTYSATLPIDVMLNIGNGFANSFLADWSNSGGTGDVRSAVEGSPEPSALLLTLVGGAGLAWFRRRNRLALQHC